MGFTTASLVNNHIADQGPRLIPKAMTTFAAAGIEALDTQILPMDPTLLLPMILTAPQ